MRDARLAIRTRQLQSSTATATAATSIGLSTRPDMLDTAAIRNTAGTGPHTAQQDAAAASLDTAAAAPLERFAAFGTHTTDNVCSSSSPYDNATAADDNTLLQYRFRGAHGDRCSSNSTSGATAGGGSGSTEPQLLRTQKVLLRAQENISKELVWKVKYFNYLNFCLVSSSTAAVANAQLGNIQPRSTGQTTHFECQCTYLRVCTILVTHAVLQSGVL
jgi:hypothetical protein